MERPLVLRDPIPDPRSVPLENRPHLRYVLRLQQRGDLEQRYPRSPQAAMARAVSI